MEIVRTLLNDLLLLRPRIPAEAGRALAIDRAALVQVGIVAPFVQDNHSRSTRDVLRGLHYQIQHPQGKLVRVIRGEIFDVVVDLRLDSPTFGRCADLHLVAEDGLLLWIPPGYAHGFQVLSAQADFLYSVTDYRHPEHERTLLWSDPTLAIPWPRTDTPPILSPKDEQGIPLAETVVMLEAYR
ncbi:MAG: dTDP-4-dehydrorhamnose 3,5-epimerase [Magnetococcales bacterium]|nr:dTDP-4-dehydrorhamnose 3,5-epimerase [Magnetococcales bacterium]